MVLKKDEKKKNQEEQKLWQWCAALMSEDAASGTDEFDECCKPAREFGEYMSIKPAKEFGEYMSINCEFDECCK